MNPLTPVSALDSNPLVALAACGSERLEEQTTTLTEAAASWQPQAMTTDRRREPRIRCHIPALLVALEDSGQALDAAPWKVVVRDLSHSGVGISHMESMPHRLVLLSFETASSEPVWILARLKWCRFKRADAYESGGQILRVFKPGE